MLPLGRMAQPQTYRRFDNCRRESGPPPVEELFALSIDHLSVRNGELLWADQKIPLNFDVRNANVEMDYSFLRGRYDGHLALAKVDTAIQDLRPFSWMTSIDFSLAPDIRRHQVTEMEFGPLLDRSRWANH